MAETSAKLRGRFSAGDFVRRALRQCDAQSFPTAERTTAGSGSWRRRLGPVIALTLSIGAHAGDPADCAATLGGDPGLAAAWQILRNIDCARCHGMHYDGLAAPSIVDYVRTQSHEKFDHIVLVGDPPRGMPGYQNNLLIADTIDDLYRYFQARASGRICAEARPPSRPNSATLLQQRLGATD